MSLLDLVDNHLTDKNTGHSYLNLYEQLLSNKKYTAKNILEIGICTGGSIKLWKDYFVNAENIYGLDNKDEETLFKEVGYDLNIHDVKDLWNHIRDPKVSLLTSSDAYDSTFVTNTFAENNITFDVVVDDGPHTLESMIKCIDLYCPLLKDDGILIIEDVQDWAWIETLSNQVPDNLKPYIETYDLRPIKNRWDDIVFVVNKNKNNLTSV
jgi:cephalosporin hydroxylase